MGYPQPDYTPDGMLKEIAQIVPFFKGATWENLGEQRPAMADQAEGGVDTQIMHTRAVQARGKGHFHFFGWEEEHSN